MLVLTWCRVPLLALEESEVLQRNRRIFSNFLNRSFLSHRRFRRRSVLSWIAATVGAMKVGSIVRPSGFHPQRRLKEGGAMPAIRLEVAAFGPFVPRIDKDQPLVRVRSITVWWDTPASQRS